MTKRNGILWLVGAAGLAVFVYLFRGKVHFDWAMFWRQLRFVSVGHIVAGIALIYATYWMRAVRWAVFVSPTKKVSAASLLGSQFIGFTAVALFGKEARVHRSGQSNAIRIADLSPGLQMIGTGNGAGQFQVRIGDAPSLQVFVTDPKPVDLIVTFRNFHNWMDGGFAVEALAASFQALKPGGILGIEEHRGPNDKPQDPKAKDGYVRQDYTIALAKKAGFENVGSSEVNANPRDTKDWVDGVWTLPPTLSQGEKDRGRYVAIGEADNFVLKFRKPR